jgi:hypothetical protein
VTVTDYLIDQADIDWQKALVPWGWLLPPEVTVWLVNRFGDLFIVFEDGAVQRLDVALGLLKVVATNRDEFCHRIDTPRVADDWLMIPLVDALVESGVTLGPGQCYGFRTPPVLGGEYVIANIVPIPATEYISYCGDLHHQIKNLPDGAQVRIRVID